MQQGLHVYPEKGVNNHEHFEKKGVYGYGWLHVENMERFRATGQKQSEFEPPILVGSTTIRLHKTVLMLLLHLLKCIDLFLE